MCEVVRGQADDGRVVGGKIQLENVNALCQGMQDSVTDIRLNLSSVLGQNQSLSQEETWTIALCSAYFTEHDPLIQAIQADAVEILSEAHLLDAKSAAAIMAMNAVYFRFRHMVAKDSYQQMRASLRMNCIGHPASSREMFELCCVACAAIEGCEACILSHEEKLAAALSEAHVHEAVKIAAVVKGATIALG